jgi:hypothetical protein
VQANRNFFSNCENGTHDTPISAVRAPRAQLACEFVVACALWCAECAWARHSAALAIKTVRNQLLPASQANVNRATLEAIVNTGTYWSCQASVWCVPAEVGARDVGQAAAWETLEFSGFGSKHRSVLCFSPQDNETCHGHLSSVAHLAGSFGKPKAKRRKKR